jgi:hypothetical protein
MSLRTVYLHSYKCTVYCQNTYEKTVYCISYFEDEVEVGDCCFDSPDGIIEAIDGWCKYGQAT